MLRNTREALAYVARFRGQVFVIKLGQQVIEIAEDRGVIEDIRLLHEIGIKVVVCHSKPRLSLRLWPSFQRHPKICSIRNVESVSAALGQDLIPVVYCGQVEDPISDVRVMKLAIACRAQKIIFMTHSNGMFHKGSLIRECTLEQATNMLGQDRLLRKGMRTKVECAVKALESGVGRVHIISGKNEDTLVAEVFSSEGVGTMFYRELYQEIRNAQITDTQSIRSILYEADIPNPPSYAEIRMQVEMYVLFVADGHTLGCMQLVPNKDSGSLGIAYLAALSTCDKPIVMEQLLDYAFERAGELDSCSLFVRPDKHEAKLRLAPWFQKHNFQESHLRYIDGDRSAHQKVLSAKVE